MRLSASCNFTHAASFKSTGYFRLRCDNGIIKGISQIVLDYFRLETDRNVRGANLQYICTYYPRNIKFEQSDMFTRIHSFLRVARIYFENLLEHEVIQTVNVYSMSGVCSKVNTCTEI
jgi:hypothetical protein